MPTKYIPCSSVFVCRASARPRRTNGASAQAPAAPATEAPALAPEATAASAPPATISVPEVVGLNLEAAQHLLQTKGLVGEPGGERPDERVPGLVIESDPPASTPLPPGSSVRLVVSTGPAEVAAPASEVAAPAGDGGGEEKNDDDKNEDKGKEKEKGKDKKKDD